METTKWREGLPNENPPITRKYEGPSPIPHCYQEEDFPEGTTPQSNILNLLKDLQSVRKVMVGELSLEDLDPDFINDIVEEWYWSRSNNIGDLRQWGDSEWWNDEVERVYFNKNNQ